MRQINVSYRTEARPSWAAPIASFVVWGAATASVVAWGLAFWPHDGQPLAPSVVMEQVAPLGAHPADLGRVLGAGHSVGADPVAPSLLSRLALLGIAKRGADMAALIAVDGQAAKPFAKGAEVLPGLVLQSVSLQQANLGASPSGPVQLRLEMPKRAEPARAVVQ
jgi:hypothetical protein